LPADASIERINGKDVSVSRKGQVWITSLSPGGLHMLTPLRFPISDRYELTISFQVEEASVIVSGHVVWHRQLDSLVKHGIRFDMDEADRMTWLGLMNRELLYKMTLQQPIFELYRQMSKDILNKRLCVTQWIV